MVRHTAFSMIALSLFLIYQATPSPFSLIGFVLLLSSLPPIFLPSSFMELPPRGDGSVILPGMAGQLAGRPASPRTWDQKKRSVHSVMGRSRLLMGALLPCAPLFTLTCHYPEMLVENFTLICPPSSNQILRKDKIRFAKLIFVSLEANLSPPLQFWFSLHPLLSPSSTFIGNSGVNGEAVRLVSLSTTPQRPNTSNFAEDGHKLQPPQCIYYFFSSCPSCGCFSNTRPYLSVVSQDITPKVTHHICVL